MAQSVKVQGAGPRAGGRLQRHHAYPAGASPSHTACSGAISVQAELKGLVEQASAPCTLEVTSTAGDPPREDGKQARTGGSETGRAGRMRQAPAAGEGAPPRRARGRVTPTQGTLSPPHREAAAQRGSPKVTRLARAGAGV